MKNFCLTKGLDKIEKIYGKNILGNTLFLLLKNRKTAKSYAFYFFASTTSNFSPGVGLAHSYNQTKIKIGGKLSILSHRFNQPLPKQCMFI